MRTHKKSHMPLLIVSVLQIQHSFPNFVDINHFTQIIGTARVCEIRDFPLLCSFEFEMFWVETPCSVERATFYCVTTYRVSQNYVNT
jgi:hypothetical protein